MSSTLMNDMAEKHNGMFGQVDKRNQLGNCSPIYQKRNSRLVRYLKSTAHNNANSAPAKEAVNDYDL